MAYDPHLSQPGKPAPDQQSGRRGGLPGAEARGSAARWLGATLLLLLFAVIGLIAINAQLSQFLQGQANLGEFLVLYSMASIYALSYLAFRAFQRPAREKRLENDFRLLGMDDVKQEMERYGQAQHAGNYVLNVTLATAFTAIGLGLFFWPPLRYTSFVLVVAQQPALIDLNTLQAMRFGFLGAYVFSIQLIYRRYTTSDMQPAVYLYCAIVIVCGLIFNFVAFEALQYIAGSQAVQAVTGIGAGLLAIVAFSLGYFPYLAITWFNRLSYQALGVSQRREDALSLSLIDGISSLHEVRLRDNGVDNVQNLAAVEISELLVNSTFSAQQVIDWVDQAILYLYLDANGADSFRRAGVRTASDFNDLWKSAIGPDDTFDKDKIAAQLQSTVERLNILRTAIAQGPNLHYVLQYWKNAAAQTQAQADKYAQERLRAIQQDAVRYRTDPTGRQLLSQEFTSVQQHLSDLGIELSWPDTPEAIVGQGVLYQEAGDYTKAAEAFTEAIKRNPDYAEAHNSLAWLYVEHFTTDRNKLQQALEHAQRAVTLQATADSHGDTYAAYLDTLAVAQIHLGDLSAAEKNLLAAQQVEGVSSEGQKYIAAHLDLLNEKKQAQVAAISPDGQPVVEPLTEAPPK